MFENLYAAENLVSPLSPKGKVETFVYIIRYVSLGAKGSKGSKGEMDRHTLKLPRPHWQFSSGTPTDLYRHTRTAGCPHKFL